MASWVEQGFMRMTNVSEKGTHVPCMDTPQNALNPDLSLGFCDEGLKYNLPKGRPGREA